MTAPWIVAAVLAVLLVVLVAGLFGALAMGRAHIDLGWGRSFHELGPITVRIAAPRELVYDIASAPYAGRAGSGSGIDLIASDRSLVVAAHHTKVHFYSARTVEAVELEPPARIGFRHLTGPVPFAVEEFRLETRDGGTELRYSGQLGIDYFIWGRIAARRWVRPQWERVVGEHLDELRERAEARAARERDRAGRGGSVVEPDAGEHREDPEAGEEEARGGE